MTSRIDRILELVDDMTQDEVEKLVSELFQILDEDHFQSIQLRYFTEDDSAPSS